jgi:Mn2+/Fe2+ NRAMP family transporter
MSINLEQSISRNRDGLRAAVLASLGAGIPAGLLARLAMAVIGAAGGTSMMAVVGQLTVPGTLRIVIVPMIFGIPFAALLLWIGRRLWRDRPLAIRMSAYALGALVLPGLLFMTDSEFNLSGANREIGRLAFAPAFLLYGLLVGLIGERVLARRPGSPAPMDSDPDTAS